MGERRLHNSFVPSSWPVLSGFASDAQSGSVSKSGDSRRQKPDDCNRVGKGIGGKNKEARRSERVHLITRSGGVKLLTETLQRTSLDPGRSFWTLNDYE